MSLDANPNWSARTWIDSILIDDRTRSQTHTFNTSRLQTGWPQPRSKSSPAFWAGATCSAGPARSTNKPILNIRRKTTLGFSIDFAFLNILGMASYAIYNIALYSWPTVRHEYAGRYPSHPEPTVQLNDIVYASHGAILAAIIYSQFYPALWRFNADQGSET
jgi:hypothetical protein